MNYDNNSFLKIQAQFKVIFAFILLSKNYFFSAKPLYFVFSFLITHMFLYLSNFKLALQ